MYEPKNSIKVLKETEKYLEENLELENRLDESKWIYHSIGMIIPQTFENLFSGHFFPYLESQQELQISFNLVCFGLYKQAFVSLRSALELGLLSVYYNINDDGHNTVKDWLSSKDSYDSNTPRAGKVWKILLSNPNIKEFNDKHDLRKTFDELGYLHNYVHTKGAKFSNRMGLLKGNSQTFESNLIIKWLKSYEDVIFLICILHLLKYPLAVVRFDYSKKFGIDIPSFGGLQEYYIDKIAKMLPEGYLKDIEEIAKKDKQTQETIKEIKSFPDMTDEEVENQALELEKMFIEDGEGFILWLESQKNILKAVGETEFSDSMKMRIEILRSWAIENDFMNPKFERLGIKIRKK